MGGRIVDLLNGPHRTTEALLPWLLNGTLTESERSAVEQHLQACAQCREELARQRGLMNLYAAAGAGASSLDADDAYAKLQSRLVEQPRPRTRAPLAWWRLGFGVQTAVVLLLGAALFAQMLPRWFGGADAPYRGLGSAQQFGGDALVMFDPAVSEARVRRALQQAGARIVDGPTAAGAYVVRFDGPLSTGLTSLRGDVAVVRVEPLGPQR